jgi:hypothetical protein
MAIPSPIQPPVEWSRRWILFTLLLAAVAPLTNTFWTIWIIYGAGKGDIDLRWEWGQRGMRRHRGRHGRKYRARWVGYLTRGVWRTAFLA